MKKNTALLSFIVFIGFCSPALYQDSLFRGKTFESKSGHIHKGNRFIFNNDSSFSYTGHGPAVFLSMGIWRYDDLNKEIILESQKAPDKWINPKTVDTLWVDLSDKRVQVITKRALQLDGITYYTK